MFYNGLDQRAAKEVMRLSDAYEYQEECYSMEIKFLVDFMEEQ